jgi:RNA polymerase sigma factor for flagellar operon FliA
MAPVTGTGDPARVERAPNDSPPTQTPDTGLDAEARGGSGRQDIETGGAAVADAEKRARKSVRELIDDGQALVRSLALNISRNVPVPVDLDDLIAYGQVGLAEAAREFDPAVGTQFTTFAYYRIRGAIYDGVSKMSWTSRARYNRLRYERMANETLQEEAVGLSSADTLEVQARWFRSISEKLAVVYLASGVDDERGGLRDSALEDPRATPSALIAGREIYEKLSHMVDSLPPTEKRLIRTIYFEGATLQDAANMLGISKSWASRMHAKVLEQLARSLRRIGAE